MLHFLPQTFEVQVTDETLPELDELFEITLVSAVSDDGLVGSTNTSGASINPMMQSSEVTIVANDYPFGLLQFGREVGVPPQDEGMILPLEEVPTVSLWEQHCLVFIIHKFI